MLGLLSLAMPERGHAGTLQAAAAKHASYQGISFDYDAALAASVTAQTVPEQRGDANTASWLTHPEHVVFTFNGFQATNRMELGPAIYVFPVKSSYRYLNPDDPTDFWLNGIRALESLLARRPDLSKPSDRQHQSFAIPFLPLINAGGDIWKKAYLDFRNGSGIRYLIHFSQDVSPVNAENSVYTFQGLSTDGKYYVAAVFPAFLVSPPPTPAGGEPDVSNYNGQMGRRIEQARDSEFAPNLAVLDEVIRSLTVGRTAPSSTSIPGMPATGDRAFVGWVPGLLVVTGLGGVFVGWALRRAHSPAS
jgi:hypothetical protein